MAVCYGDQKGPGAIPLSSGRKRNRSGCVDQFYPSVCKGISNFQVYYGKLELGRSIWH